MIRARCSTRLSIDDDAGAGRAGTIVGRGRCEGDFNFRGGPLPGPPPTLVGVEPFHRCEAGRLGTRATCAEGRRCNRRASPRCTEVATTRAEVRAAEGARGPRCGGAVHGGSRGASRCGAPWRSTDERCGRLRPPSRRNQGCDRALHAGVEVTCGRCALRGTPMGQTCGRTIPLSDRKPPVPSWCQVPAPRWVPLAGLRTPPRRVAPRDRRAKPLQAGCSLIIVRRGIDAALGNLEWVGLSRNGAPTKGTDHDQLPSTPSPPSALSAANGRGQEERASNFWVPEDRRRPPQRAEPHRTCVAKFSAEEPDSWSPLGTTQPLEPSGACQDQHAVAARGAKPGLRAGSHLPRGRGPSRRPTLPRSSPAPPPRAGLQRGVGGNTAYDHTFRSSR